MVRIAIVEHDASVSARLHELLEIWQSRNFVPMSVLEYNDELEFISAYPSPLDMVLLSVEQPHMGGMEIVRRIRHFDRDVRIVLLSEGCDAAPLGYQYDVFDYLLKPVDANALFYCLHRAASLYAALPSRTHTVQCDGIVRRLYLRDILYVEVLGHFLVYHVADEREGVRKYKVKGQLVRIRDKFTHSGFFRVNRSILVNVARADKITRDTLFYGERQIAIARSSKGALRRYLAGIGGL